MSRRREAVLIVGILAALAAAGAGGFFVWTRTRQGPTIAVSLSKAWYDAAHLNPAPYELALARAGARIVNVGPDDLGKLDAILDRAHGVVLVGGGDVDPALFGGDPATASRVDRRQDEFEIELLRRAEARGLPVLAICRGAQVLAVACGGTLVTLEGEAARRHGVALKSLAAHAVRIEPGTRLHAALGEGPHRVSSTHVQAIRHAGPRLRVAATADDGVIEAVELPGKRLVLGIQWHPEWESLSDPRPLSVFRMFVEEAGRR